MNSTALATIQPEELDVIQRAARLLAVSNYFDGKGDNPQAIAMLATKIMAGRELGFGPFASANNIHVIKSKPVIGANLMASAVKSNPRYDYRVKEITNECCSIEFFEREGDRRVSLGVSTFTIKDAKTMELLDKDNWKKSPRNMLFARAMSNGVRWFTPDVFSGNAVYIPDELGADEDADGNVIEVTARRVEDAPVAAQAAQGEAQRDNAPSNPFDDATPYWQRDWQQLTGAQYDLVDWIRQLHRKQSGPCSPAQYGYVVAIMDELTNGQHSYILALLCQSEISKDNKPSKDVASALLKFLAKTIKVKDGQGIEVEEPNPQYRKDMADMITAMSQPVADVAA